MENIYNFSENEFNDYFTSNGEKSFRSKQIISWIYRKKVKDFFMMSDIKKELQQKLHDFFYFPTLTLVTKSISNDGTIKFLFKLEDDNLIETVLMHQEYGYSLCVTSQIGCNMGCMFCASGLKKKVRNLETGEMVLQVLMVEELTNVKIMIIMTIY